ncbi:PREDICTED: growth factor receptor-bound protein 14-like isoform X1 [Habropoda laboriosa]|uniref:growth factor receptor-bound protein 14-like isoform X1 n=1 Tax=Habropoda laboriosa TaxID=597456 RepID=UPI00083DF31F|nr:PREDICTED: growth factor receptor-bound protein 14-like isoform X1 [Habropoda laboriosa]XP_017798335.1 PREDICTED: growth factor receptor-bound protein 14-like isoform X1 [Habropoda laboriosa]XP_017798336.1 PREDICTED: growth factor receptor-bound protein 14-like isoform X1 [Habropoda laboriosa]
MVGNAVAFANLTGFQAAETLCCNRFLHETNSPSPEHQPPADTTEPTRTRDHHFSSPSPSPPPSPSPSPPTDEQRIYTDAFLRSCAELASSCTDSICDREEYAPSWFSQVRRRCSNIRNWLPKMCSCLEAGAPFLSQPVGSYRRLTVKSNLFEFNQIPKRPRITFEPDPDEHEEDEEEEEYDDQIEELRFYNEDRSSFSIIVDRHIRTSDLCELLKVKRSLSGTEWSVVEFWPDLGIERTLEDHEDVSAMYREMRKFPSERVRKFALQQDNFKYEFYFDSMQFFSAQMKAVPAAYADDWETLKQAQAALRDYIQDDKAEFPQVFSLVWMRIGYLNVWRRTYMLLRDEKLYLARKKTEQVTPLARLSDFLVYKIPNAKRSFRAPFTWGICLRPSCQAAAENTATGESGLKVIAFHSEKSRVCWLTAMRLAKYGKQLRENYRAFKNKQCEQPENPKDRYVNYNVSNESVRSHVAMDFTGSVGRIVEDPKEAKNIAENEGVNWRRTWRPFSRPPPGCAVVRLHGLDDGIHVLQPWFHRGLKRDVAAAIVRDHGSVDGVFLVRESKSNLGAYVLTYKYSEKVFHAQIQPVFDERCNCWLYTLDKGVTKFYDLLQLIEFYQLNAGCLPTRLTHYVQNGVPTDLSQPAEDGSSAASPSSAELLGHRFAAGGPAVSSAYVTGNRSI